MGIETYVRGHLDPFPSLYDRIRAAGLRRYTIWLDGADLLLTREGDDPLKGETLDLSDPVQQRWVDVMTPLFIERVARDGPSYPSEVFAFDPDAEPGRARMTYRTGLRPGAEAVEAVASAFRAAPMAVLDELRAAGIRRQWIWVEDGSAWTYRECDDLDATEAALAASATYRSWWASTTSSLDDRTLAKGHAGRARCSDATDRRWEGESLVVIAAERSAEDRSARTTRCRSRGRRPVDRLEHRQRKEEDEIGGTSNLSRRCDPDMVPEESR